MRTAALVIMLVAAFAPTSPGDAAADLRIFKATAEGSGSYDRYDEKWAFGELVLQDAAKASFTWRATIARVVFDSSGQLVSGAGPSDSRVTGSGRQDFVGFGRSGDQVVRNPGDCVVDGGRAATGSATIEPNPSPPPDAEQGTHVVLRPFGDLKLPATCSGVLGNFDDLVVWTGNDPDGAFDHRFALPKEAVAQGKIIQHVEQSAAQKAACAGMSPWTRRCTLDWSGKVTFELVEVIDTDGPVRPDDVLPDLPPLDPDEGLLLPVHGRLSRDGSRATLTVACPAGCAGTVRAYRLGAAGRPLAVRRFRAAASRPKRVTLRFRGRARRAIARAGGVRVVVSAGGTTRRTLVIRRGRARGARTAAR